MSRIGNKVVSVPAGVEVQFGGAQLLVKGPKGRITRPVAAGVRFEREGAEVRVLRDAEDTSTRANHGLMRALLANMVKGVTVGFERKLEILGVGYKAEVRGRELVLSLGYSHPVKYAFPEGIDIKAEGPTKLSVLGVDKEQVGQVASELRGFRAPDSYKGKGVRYAGERVRLKAGKSGSKK